MTESVRTALAEEIRARIRRLGPISFRDFFDLCLYHPSLGYYTRASAVTGRSGDFSTSPDVSPAFGQRLAVQAADVHERLGGGPWRLVELGPGRGLLAGDLLDGLAKHAPDALAALEEIVLVEVSPSLREEQERRLRARGRVPRLRWLRGAGELDSAPIRGLVVANEVLDALPVHAVVRREAGLRELHVDEDPAGGGFCFVEGELTRPEVGDIVERYGLCPEPGHRAEVSLAMPSLLAEVSRGLEAGAAAFVDYGHDASRLGDPDHCEGTLLAYHRHRIVEEVLSRPGEQDITAHVNWTHFEDSAAEAGLTVAGRTYQDRFLLALGIVEDMARDPEGGPEAPGETSFRLSARSLVLPASGGGRRFEVACLVRGIPADLRGLSDPLSGLS